jgi:8-oxo-dGTP pyrophosphatase MutT (NUDIX family)
VGAIRKFLVRQRTGRKKLTAGSQPGDAITHVNEEKTDPRHVVAVATLIVREGRVLALRRAPDNLAGPGLWETVSGRVEQGEQPLAAALREVSEEAALDVRIAPRPIGAYAAQRRGEPMIVILYRAEYVAGEVSISNEHDQFAWLTAAEFAERSSLRLLCEAVEDVLSVRS